MKVEYRGWPNCHRLANKEIELIATTDVGPRVIRLGFIGEKNVFGENENDSGQVGGDTWRIYGGHRLWHAPEEKPRSYAPDNSPVQVEEGDNRLLLKQDTEPTTGVQKTIELTLFPNANHIIVRHWLRNDNIWPVALAPWALSVMSKNGFAIVPHSSPRKEESEFAPSSLLILWSYTDMSDPRWRWGRQFITLCQDPNGNGPQKAGLHCSENWAAYAVDGYLFLKTFQYRAGVNYPDNGCSVEVYTDPAILEVETLGPLTTLKPGQSVEHIEHWFLHKGVAVTNDDESIEKKVLPLAQQALHVSGTRASHLLVLPLNNHTRPLG